VDANVLSEATKPRPSRKVVNWIRRHELEIVVDPIVLGEIRFGILLLPKGRRRDRLERWFADGIRRIHCLNWDSAYGSSLGAASCRAAVVGPVDASQGQHDCRYCADAWTPGGNEKPPRFSEGRRKDH
jgi:predicted nucleic acid-binding protein